MNNSKQHTFLISWEQDNSWARHTIILKDLDVGQILYQYTIFENSGLKNILIEILIDGESEPIKYDTLLCRPTASNPRLCNTCEDIMDWYLLNISIGVNAGQYPSLDLEAIAELLITKHIHGSI